MPRHPIVMRIHPIDTPERLREARRRLGMTQQELAETLGLTQRSISRMETGAQPIEPRTDLAVRYLLVTATPIESEPRLNPNPD